MGNHNQSNRHSRARGIHGAIGVDSRLRGNNSWIRKKAKEIIRLKLAPIVYRMVTIQSSGNTRKHD